MSSILVAFLFAAGVSAWAYVQVSRRTGGASPKNDVLVAAAVGILAFIIFWSILDLIKQ